MLDRQPIHIALDARTVHAPIRRGTGKNLVDLYTTLLQVRPQWTVTGFHRTENDLGPSVPRYRSRRIGMPGDRFDAWQRWRLPQSAWQAGADLLHCPANSCPTWNPVATLVTIHDLLPLEGPAADATRFDRSVRHAVARGMTIVTPSHFTARQLMGRYNADGRQIVVNAWAPDRAMRYVEDPERIAAVLKRYGVRAPFMLHLGAPQPRKNTQRVLTAYAALPAALRREWPLLIIGMDHPMSHARLMQDAQELRVADHVRVHGFADEADMPALFSAAEVLVYPSLAEGFGLPILDAFITRTAVLTSSGTSLPEVAGDAACYVEPTSLDEIAAGMQSLITDDGARRSLIELGAERVKLFTWEKTAERFVRAVSRALGMREGRQRAAA